MEMSWCTGIEVNGIIQQSAMQLSWHIKQEEMHSDVGFQHAIKQYAIKWVALYIATVQ